VTPIIRENIINIFFFFIIPKKNKIIAKINSAKKIILIPIVYTFKITENYFISFQKIKKNVKSLLHVCPSCNKGTLKTILAFNKYHPPPTKWMMQLKNKS